MQDQIKRAIKLAKITGDKVILIDQNKVEDAFVVMNLDEYEHLLAKKHFRDQEIVNLTETELLDRINRDIAMWKSEQITDKWNDKEIFDQGEDEESEDDYDNLYYYENEENSNHFRGRGAGIDKESGLDIEFDDYDDFNSEFNSASDEKKTVKQPWRIPEQIKKSAEEVF